MAVYAAAGVRADWAQADCWVAPLVDDHSSLVVQPADYSAPVDWAADGSAPGGCCCLVEADSARADCWAVLLAAGYCSARAGWAADDSAAADLAPDDCSADPRADDLSVLVARLDDYSVWADCSVRAGLVVPYLRPDVRSPPADCPAELPVGSKAGSAVGSPARWRAGLGSCYRAGLLAVPRLALPAFPEALA